MIGAEFFNEVRRSLFRRLSQSAVDGINTIYAACEEAGLSDSHTAYVLATAYHETGGRMQPVREGFAKTDLGARRAVTAMFNKGRIKTNYALPTGPHKMSYYGRGYVQLTWLGNYEKTGKALGFDLVANPDKMLEPEFSAKAMIWGMVNGAYRGKSLKDKLPATTPPSLSQWRSARGIINGDVGLNGTRVAGYAQTFFHALGKDT